MSDNNTGSGNRNSYDDRATAVDLAFRELARDLREEKHQTGLYCLPSNHLTELRSQVTGVTVIHTYEKQEDGSISDTVVAVEPGKEGDPSWIINDIDNYRLRFTITSRPEDSSPDAIRQCKDAIRQLYDQAYSSAAQIQLDPYTAARKQQEKELPSVDIDIDDLSGELQEEEEDEVILLEDVVEEASPDTATQRAEAYLDSTSMIEQEINKGGIGRKINLANARFCKRPGEEENYNHTKVETAMMTALTTCLDELVAEEAGYDRFIIISENKAYDLGSTEMLIPYKNAVIRPLNREERLELIERLDLSLEDKNITPPAREKLMKAMLDKGPTYVAMAGYCKYNAERLMIYELDSQKTAAILKHIIPKEGRIAVMTTSPSHVRAITDEALSNKGLSRFDDIIDTEKACLKLNGRTITFVSRASKKEFQQYVMSEDVRVPYILGEHLIDVFDRSEEERQSRPSMDMSGLVGRAGRKSRIPETPDQQTAPEQKPEEEQQEEEQQEETDSENKVIDIKEYIKRAANGDE